MSTSPSGRDSHPGIVFKSGPSGRRAALAGGPDVWEIASALRRTAGDESSRVADLAKEFGLHERQVVLALDYAAAHRNEVQARIIANDQALIEAERIPTPVPGPTGWRNQSAECFSSPRSASLAAIASPAISKQLKACVSLVNWQLRVQPDRLSRCAKCRFPPVSQSTGKSLQSRS